ncbi:MAG TPA: hypothetical protein VFW39_02350 [Sphingomicrobium sp.]|nr:hypothetical protein [Sphingomicrobium sp.]
MSVLKKLKLSNTTPVHVADRKQNARTKLLRFLQEQKALAQAELEGRAYIATKVVFHTGENGQRVRAEAPRHVRRGWFRDAAGLLFFQARYGNARQTSGKVCPLSKLAISKPCRRSSMRSWRRSMPESSMTRLRLRRPNAVPTSSAGRKVRLRSIGRSGRQ